MGARNRCPCGLPAAYGECCGRFHRGDGHAPTAERLMRSRYSAFAVGDMDYLQRTWHRSTAPVALRNDPGTSWTGLVVTATTGGGIFDAEGTVTFTAHHRTGDDDGAMSETSRFVKENGRWFYVEPVD